MYQICNHWGKCKKPVSKNGYLKAKEEFLIWYSLQYLYHIKLLTPIFWITLYSWSKHNYKKEPNVTLIYRNKPVLVFLKTRRISSTVRNLRIFVRILNLEIWKSIFLMSKIGNYGGKWKFISKNGRLQAVILLHIHILQKLEEFS